MDLGVKAWFGGLACSELVESYSCNEVLHGGVCAALFTHNCLLIVALSDNYTTAD